LIVVPVKTELKEFTGRLQSRPPNSELLTLFHRYDDELDEADDGSDSEKALTEQMMDVIDDVRDEDDGYGNSDDDDDDDGDDDDGYDDENIENRQPESGKTALNKSQLHELFDFVNTDEGQNDGEQSPRVANIDKKAQLSKNEVVQLFEKDTNEGGVDGHQSESASSPPLVIVTDSNTSTPSTSSSAEQSIVVVPNVKVTTIEELVKSVDRVSDDDDDDNDNDDRKEKQVTLDVKEERLVPGTNEKTAKEWMIEFTQPGDNAAAGVSTISDWTSKGGASRGSKKFKRSINFESTSEKVAKSRAVRLLMTYIQLQEDENRHLTEALNLATRGQTEETNRYVDDEVEQLKQAVGNEREIQRIRQEIRAEEDTEDADIEDDAAAAAEDQLEADDVSDDVSRRALLKSRAIDENDVTRRQLGHRWSL